MGLSFTPGLDVIILAGGRGSRMGGIDKAQVSVNGERLIDILLDEVSMIGDLMQVAVVSTRDIELRPGVKLAKEDPPFSGPAAAIAAGTRALSTEPSTRTAILAVDAPESAQLIDDLRHALDSNPAAEVAIVEGQPLCALWNSAALQRVCSGQLSNRSAHSLYEDAQVVSVAGDGSERDYDTLEELAEFGEID